MFSLKPEEMGQNIDSWKVVGMTSAGIQSSHKQPTGSIKQDWPVTSELVPGGMHFHFCLQRAIRSDKVPWENQWKLLRVVGFRNNRVEVK